LGKLLHLGVRFRSDEGSFIYIAATVFLIKNSCGKGRGFKGTGCKTGWGQESPFRGGSDKRASLIHLRRTDREVCEHGMDAKSLVKRMGDWGNELKLRTSFRRKEARGHFHWKFSLFSEHDHVFYFHRPPRKTRPLARRGRRTESQTRCIKRRDPWIQGWRGGRVSESKFLAVESAKKKVRRKKKKFSLISAKGMP